METALPTLSINLGITCPHCENYFCMIDDTDLNEEGALLASCCPSGSWIDEHEKFKCEVTCPECGNVFLAKNIQW